MTGQGFALESHGDTIGSYAVLTAGYGFTSDRGFLVRVAGGPAFTIAGEQQPGGSSRLTIGGPFVLASLGSRF